jgi:hypothetical protein
VLEWIAKQLVYFAILISPFYFVGFPYIVLYQALRVPDSVGVVMTLIWLLSVFGTLLSVLAIVEKSRTIKVAECPLNKE